ncbi:MAG: bifunctional phosphopantothenoylcysteine decarboxylase/phosphopantothenate--cysteine ligase CoaBC [Gammaproteobacteria bacterium]|nr:bifunctional phosphopantothenoylcysteine decarboxylase/phosphopantothenate--cysteine ligase CoaBC [Gammaproteobacteria bacterium]
MTQQTVLLGISGGIAAFKTPELVRRLVAADYRVLPVLTTAAEKFVTTHTLAALAGERVRRSLWDEEAEHAMSHIELARAADIVVVAPATADLMAKFAYGLADDLLTTAYAATQAPVLLAPAMNQQMFAHVATQRSIEQLKADGVLFVGPNSGAQACGEIGPGRMAEPEEIVSAIAEVLEGLKTASPLPTKLALGRKILVTAGPTRERIDPVRYLTNASSGRQGFAVAAAAQAMGAEVTLVSGPTMLPTPPGVQRIDIETASEMYCAVHEQVAECDIMFAVAAVADYKPSNPSGEKIKKKMNVGTRMTLELEETVDIVSSVATLDSPPFLVGFAAETHDVLTHARAKRTRKNLDVIVVNDVSDSTIGFDSLENQVTLIHDHGETEIPCASKALVAEQIVSQSLGLFEKTTKRRNVNGA